MFRGELNKTGVSLACSQATIHGPRTTTGVLSAPKLLAVLTGNTDATGSTETPHKPRPNPLREATSYQGYQAEHRGLIFIPHGGAQLP